MERRTEVISAEADAAALRAILSPEAISRLSALMTLILSKCRKLTELPEAIGQLAALTTLDLCGCSNIERNIPDSRAAVRAAGGWLPWLNAPRKELLALRHRLPALRECGRAEPLSKVPLHERLFLKTPDDAFSHVLTFWRSDRDRLLFGAAPAAQTRRGAR